MASWSRKPFKRRCPIGSPAARSTPSAWPKAIQTMLSNCRGAKVGIPEADAKAILLRLAQAAEDEGHVPPRALGPAPVYRQLALVLEQLGVGEATAKNGLGL
jgi:hypothetical protein